MSLPKLLTPDEVAEYLDVSLDTLARWRAAGNEGPLHVKIGQRVAYPETAVSDYITAQMTGNKAASPAAIQAGFVQGRAGVREALKARTEAMQALDRQSDGEDGVTPLVMGIAGQGPQDRFERHFNVPATPVEAPPAPHILQSR